MQLARIECNNTKRIDTIAKARIIEFISEGQIMRAKLLGGIAQDDQERAQDAAFEPTKWGTTMHGYKELEIAVFEYIKLLTAKHFLHLCMGISVDHEGCGSSALVRLDTNFALRSDGTIRDIKTKVADAVANEDYPVKCFGNILR